MKFYLTVAFFIVIFHGLAQRSVVVSGKVTESETGTPIPFANIIFTGTTDGAITDFDGNFVARTDLPVDSIEVRYIGFVTRRKGLSGESTQIINFQLDEDVQTLAAVVLYAGENPAFPILREVIKNKKKNDKRSLDAYEYEAYTKIELDMDNISDQIRRRKVIQKITQVLDSIDQIAGEDGKPVLPFFISEAISRFYYRKNPTYRHEHILKTKITGVGLTDGTTTSQVIGSTLQEYNFYQNWLNIVSKEFASPIADSWKLYYDYDLMDSLYIDDDYVYRVDFYPKNDQDLAFQGTMWITREDYALKRIDASVTESANLNFIDKIKIQQDLRRTAAGAWIPEKSRVVVDGSEVSKNTAGFLAKFYVSAKDFVVNQPKSPDFYQNPVSMEMDAQEYPENFWEENRHDSLTATEENVYQMIDTLKKIPIVKTSLDAAKFGATGYIKTGPIDIGPYTVFFGDNDMEGIRLGVGARTNFQFSKKLTIGGFYAYGTKDNRGKYLSYFDFVLNREKWSTIRIERQKEIDQIWTLNQNVPLMSFFYSFSRFGVLTQPFMYTKNRIYYQKHLWTGLNQTIEFKQQSFHPRFDFQFTPENGDPATMLSDFDISEITFSTRWGKDEIFVINDNERWSLGTIRWPAITFDYTYGIPNFLGSDLTYHRLKLRFEKRQKMAALGISYFDLSGGIIFGDVPYPLLFNHLGNETPVYANFTYNLMNYFEFSSDQYVALRYRHSFEGLVLNKIPLMRKLKWRLVGNMNMVYGGMKDSNKDLTIYPQDQLGNPMIPFFTLSTKPYAEVGYGIENIFKIFRVDAFHRLTYLNHPNINNFGLKFSVQIII